MKVAINLALIVEMVAFCEAVALAEKGGVDRAVAVDAMLKSVVASPVMGYRGPFILEMPDKPLADVTLQQKDMVLALEVARRQGSPAPLGAVANELLNACRGLGIDHRDFRDRVRCVSHARRWTMTERFKTNLSEVPIVGGLRETTKAGSTCRCSSSSIRRPWVSKTSCSDGPCFLPERATTVTSTATQTSSSSCFKARGTSTPTTARLLHRRAT